MPATIGAVTRTNSASDSKLNLYPKLVDILRPFQNCILFPGARIRSRGRGRKCRRAVIVDSLNFLLSLLIFRHLFPNRKTIITILHCVLGHFLEPECQFLFIIHAYYFPQFEHCLRFLETINFVLLNAYDFYFRYPFRTLAKIRFLQYLFPDKSPLNMFTALTTTGSLPALPSHPKTAVVRRPTHRRGPRTTTGPSRWPRPVPCPGLPDPQGYLVLSRRPKPWRLRLSRFSVSRGCGAREHG